MPFKYVKIIGTGRGGRREGGKEGRRDTTEGGENVRSMGMHVKGRRGHAFVSLERELSI